MPRRATRQQRQQRSAAAEEVESAKPHMQPTKGGRARRAPWPLGSSSGGRRPLCVFRVRNPDLSGAGECSFQRSDEVKNYVGTAPLHEEQQHNQAQAIYGRLHAHNHNNHHHRLETDLTRNAHGRHRAPTNQTFFPPNPPGVYGHGHMAMECLQQGGEGRCRPGPHGPWPAAARNSLARACSEGCCMVSGRLCQAAEGRGTQCLARPPGGTGSSGEQGPWSEYTAKPQLAAPKGGYGPARPSGRWACPPGGRGYGGVALRSPS